MKRQEKDTGYQFCVFFAQYIAIKIIVRLFTRMNLIVKIIIEINYVSFDWGVKE